ncbi:MAG: cytochrome c peroxidase [Planctomycetota bacterium]
MKHALARLLPPNAFAFAAFPRSGVVGERTPPRRRWMVVGLVALCAAGCGGRAKVAAAPAVPEGFTRDEVQAILRHSPLPDPPPDPTNRFADDERAARLGRFLFFDRRLSKSGEVACATCHAPDRGWSDGRQLATGEGDLQRHSMTLLNVAYNRWFFWDGRADSLWAQALQPLEDPREHGGSRLEVAHLLHGDPQLREAYTEVFGALPELSDAARFPRRGRPVPDDAAHPDAKAWASMSPADRAAVDAVFVNVGKALAAFERGIVSRGSRFDVFVEGLVEHDPEKQRALSASERNGLKLFVGRAGCSVCHAGPNFTDREFHNTRVPPLAGAEKPGRADPGRYAGIDLVAESPFRGTGAFSDAPAGAAEDKLAYLLKSGHTWGEFKTPSLRDASRTAPYMHRGQFATLGEVLRFYNTLEGAAPAQHAAERILVPLGLSEAELADLAAFLDALAGSPLPEHLRRQPAFP